jgi:hypothetical protein
MYSGRGQSIAFTSTNTSLVIASTFLKHGESVSVKIAVEANGGTPKGPVSLLTSDSPAVGAFSLDTHGTVASTTNALPAHQRQDVGPIANLRS